MKGDDDGVCDEVHDGVCVLVYVVCDGVSDSIQSCEANHCLALHMCTVLSYGKHSQSAYYVIPLLSYEIQIISTIACVWSSLALARVLSKIQFSYIPLLFHSLYGSFVT